MPCQLRGYDRGGALLPYRRQQRTAIKKGAEADVMLVYTAKAQTLKKAVIELRAALTPEQLEAARLPRILG